MANSENFNMGQFAQLFNRLTPGQQVSMVLFVILVTGGIFLASYFVNQENYQVLYSGMNPEDAGAVIAKLKEQKIPYRLEAGGTAVSVPASRLDELRVQLAAGGLPQSGRIGFEIFDRTNFGMSEFAEQVNFRRALEGELARSIASLTEVASARVHLVLPKAALFQPQEERAKAAVVVKLRSGKGLSSESIFGISYLMASAVPGLKPENISIMDVQGNVLSLPSKGSLTPGLSQPEMETQIALEKELNAKILSILEPVVGKGKVGAKTSVELNLDRVEETSETFDPDKAAVARRQVSKESRSEGAGLGVGGIVGIIGNQPQAPQAPAGSAASNGRDRQDENTQFELSRTVRHTVQALGRIKKLSVAVIVDDKLVYKQDAKGKRTSTYVPRQPEELRKIRDLVNAAVGFNQERGDQVTVENLPFQILDFPAADEAPAPVGWTQQYWELVKPAGRYLGIAAIALFAYLTLLRPFKRKVLEGLQHAAAGAPKLLPSASGRAAAERSAASLPGVSGDYPKRLADVEKELEAKIENELAASELNADATKAVVIKKRIMNRAQEKPQETAQLIRSWVGPRGE